MADLILPMLQGQDLLNEISRTQPEPGSLAIWWLGQSGFAIKTRNGLLVIDPYLSEHLTAKYADTPRPHIRMTESPFRGADLHGVSLVLSTHKHSDHMDPGTLPDLMAGNPQATLIVPCSQFDHARTLGIEHEQIIAMESGDLHAQNGFLVRAIPSAHEGLDVDGDGRHLYFGYVIEADGLRLYHSGDTVPYDDLPAMLGADPFDVMFLPINGRDPSRGVAGNMNSAEAVDLASQMRPRVVVPHHYDMFTFNTVPVAEFEGEARRLAKGVAAKVLHCGERWIVHRRG